MAARRRRRRRDYQTTGPMADMQAALNALCQKFGRETLGFAVFALGGYLGYNLFAFGPDSWCALLAGRMAWPLALSLLVTGAVMMLGRQAGYWNPEALVGGELLLLSLASWHYISGREIADWAWPGAGVPGGLMGWVVGNILISLLGQVPATLAAVLAGLLSVYLLVRHTPLVYAAGTLALLPKSLVGSPPRGPDSSARDETEVSDPIEEAYWPDPTAEGHRIEAQIDGPETTPPETDQPAPEPTQESSEAELIQAELQMPAAVPARRKSRNGSAGGNALKLAREAESSPPIELLDDDADQHRWDIEGMAEIIRQTLWDFDIPVEIVNIDCGPTITQFGVQPLYIERGGQKRKIRVSRIASAADDLALALAAPAVRIEAPVPGQPYVGIEVPNPEKSIVGVKGILQSKQMARRGGMLPLALGRDTSGQPIVADLARAPHLLIAGATGSGKSACINGLIVSLLMHHGPESLRFIMVDPKLVELPGYNRIPHMIGKVVTDVEDVHGALTWLLLQMDDRYNLFRSNKVKDIASYNALARRRKKLDALPHLVLVVDELADLMMTAPEEIERQLVRLAQMARATGIHLVLATQRPSTDVVTGLIKANFPSRIAFAVTSQVDSRVILDAPGAEKLLGQGDMLFMLPDKAMIQRVQGSYVNDAEIRRVVDWWETRDREENPDRPAARVAPWIGVLDRLDDEEELLADAVDAIRGEKSINTTFVQRSLRISYPRAARLVTTLERQGLVGADRGDGQGREVLMRHEPQAEEEDEALEKL